ncbi:MAG: MASE1 domain-containing protein [Novosphingobium sp.]
MRLARTMADPVCTAVAYFALAFGAVAFGRFTGGVAMVWVASALLAGRLVHLPVRMWHRWIVPCGLASTVATGYFGMGWPSAVPLAVINMGEAVAVALIWRRITEAFWPHDILEWVTSFYLGIGLTVPLVSGGFAALVAWAAEGLPPLENFTHWIIGHALGLVSCLPVSHYIYHRLSRGRSFLPPTSQLPLAALVFGTFMLVTGMVFSLNMRALLVFPLVFLMISSALVPAAITTLMPLLLIGIGGVMTVMGHGPIAIMDLDFGDRLQFFQLYVGVSVLAALPLSCERHRRIIEMQEMQTRIAELERHQSAF